jgi:arylsulfatase A-like enzyme
VNVLLITTDQQRADSIGAYGNPVCRTPNLDRLAAAGTRFDACRTQHPFCQPARATILTGQYPSTHGVVFNGFDLPEEASEQSVATAFGQAGWATGLFGKAHFASTYPFFPTGALESVAGSATMPDGWTGPYFGFDHVQLVLFGHAMRLTAMQGLFSWCFGPAPMGLHYGRWLYRDGRAKGDERLRLMQPEAAGAAWDHTQTWANALPEEDHPTTWIADAAIDWLQRQAGAPRPFFGWVSFTDPHHPMDPPGRWAKEYSPDDVREVLPTRHPGELDGKPELHRIWSEGNRGGRFEWANPGGGLLTDDELATMTAGYYGMVGQLDHNIGRLLDALDELALTDDTLVIMTTDHGEMLGEHQQIFKGPVHYDGLLRVPLIVRGPGVPAGAVIEEPVGTIDLAPTMLRAAGLPVPAHCEGAPLPGIAGQPTGTREHTLTEDDFDVVAEIPLRTVTTARYKLTRYLADDAIGELYDFEDDPGELVNRWDDASYAAVRADLLALLHDVMPARGRVLPKVGLVG